jgi:hypothetical protein
VTVRLDPHLGEVNEAAVCNILRRIGPALKIGMGQFDRTSATIICDADIRRLVANLIKNSNSHEFGWARLQPAQWHASLCFRLTIGSTWGEIFLFKMVEEVEHVTENTAAHISGGKRWRRSGNIAIRVARGAIRFLLQWSLDSLSNDELLDCDAFHHWMVATAKVNPHVAIICGYTRAVALNLQLDDAVRRGCYEDVIKISAIFHWLTVSRGRNQYKEILAEQLAEWALSNEEERDTIEQATFCVNKSGRFNASDETYESMLKIVKNFLRGALHVRTFASAINCTYKANVFSRIKTQLDHDLHAARPLQASTRPTCIKTELERQRVNAYAKAFDEWVLRDATRGAEIKAFRTGAIFPIYIELTAAGAIVDPAMTRVFEDGQVESEAIVEALCNGDSVCWDNGDEWLAAGAHASAAPPLPQPSAAPLLATHSPLPPLFPLLPPLPPASPSTLISGDSSDLVPLSAPLVLSAESAAAAHLSPAARPVLIVSRPRATAPVKKSTPAQRARALKGQLADSEQKAKSATHAAEKERIKIKRLREKPIEIDDLESFSKEELAEILIETDGTARKRDTWNDLADKVCKPNPPPIAQQVAPSKKARSTADEDDEPQLVRREKSARGRALRPPTRIADDD